MPTAVINNFNLLKCPLFPYVHMCFFNPDLVNNPVMLINLGDRWAISVNSLGKKLSLEKQTLETNLRKQKALYSHFYIKIYR